MSLVRFPLLSLALLFFTATSCFSQEAPPAMEETAPAASETADAANEDSPTTHQGQADLDEALQLKLVLEDGKQLGQVIKLLESSIQKGLDEENNQFAEEMLVASLMDRGLAIAAMILDKPLPNPQQDPRWLQVRQLAMTDLTKVIQIDPLQAEAHLVIGRLHELPMGDMPAAIAAFTKVIELEEVEPKVLAEAYARRATRQKEPKAQLADLDKAIEADSENVEYRLLRARNYYGIKKYEKCLAEIDEVLKMSGDKYATYELRGLVLLALERQEEALASFDKATELSPEAVTPYLRRGEVYGKLGSLSKAIEQIGKAIELRPENPLVYLLRADIYLRDEQPELALEDVESALTRRPGMVQAYLLKARAYELQGDKPKALKQLEELAAAMPPQVPINLQIAAYALQLDMPRQAIEAMNRALNLEPDNAMLLRLRGDSRLSLGQHQEAITDFEKALAIDPEDSGLLNNLAWTMATSPDDEVRNGKRAIELATKACELTDFKAAHILSTLAAAYAETGDFDKAKEWIKKALELNDTENNDAMALELESYKAGKPIREKKTGESSSDKPTPPATPDKPVESTPAPGRTLDF